MNSVSVPLISGIIAQFQYQSKSQSLIPHTDKTYRHIKTPVPSGWRWGWVPAVICTAPSSTVNSPSLHPVTESEPFLKCLRCVGRKSCGNFLASVSGEWQVTASVTNESSVQLRLFTAFLWRAKPQPSICQAPHYPSGKETHGEGGRGN